MRDILTREYDSINQMQITNYDHTIHKNNISTYDLRFMCWSRPRSRRRALRDKVFLVEANEEGGIQFEGVRRWQRLRDRSTFRKVFCDRGNNEDSKTTRNEARGIGLEHVKAKETLCEASQPTLSLFGGAVSPSRSLTNYVVYKINGVSEYPRDWYKDSKYTDDPNRIHLGKRINGVSEYPRDKCKDSKYTDDPDTIHLDKCAMIQKYFKSNSSNSIMASYAYNYGRFEDSYYHGVNRRTIADIEKDMISDWLSQSTTQQPLQEDMQHMNPKLQNSETQVTTILEHLMDEKEVSLQQIFDSEETVNAATLNSVEFDEFSIVNEYLSEPEETLEVSLHELDISIAQNKDDDVEKEIGVIFEWPEEPQIESKENQHLVLTSSLGKTAREVRLFTSMDFNLRVFSIHPCLHIESDTIKPLEDVR
ncbi:hypothetical protein Scep_021729 [Stephania cephalantha]|uniref:Uncharacterized protein n=1 Tax=Stephania cephalantha TaxID=152367 RepID=A0AAP0F6J5_9MAGN